LTGLSIRYVFEISIFAFVNPMSMPKSSSPPVAEIRHSKKFTKRIDFCAIQKSCCCQNGSDRDSEFMIEGSFGGTKIRPCFMYGI